MSVVGRARGWAGVVAIAVIVVAVPAVPRRAGARGDARCAPSACDYPMTIAGVSGDVVGYLQGRMLSNGGDDRRLIVEGVESAAGSCIGGGARWYGEIQWRPQDASAAGEGALRIRYDDATRVEDRSWVGTGSGSHQVTAMDVLVARDGTISGTATFVPVAGGPTDSGPAPTFAGTFSGRTALDCSGTTGVLDIPLADGTTLELPCVDTPLPPTAACEDHDGGC